LERQTSSANTPLTLLLVRSVRQSCGQGDVADPPDVAVPEVLVLVLVVVLEVDPALEPPLPAAGGEAPVSTR
jgi:hypothetical protein